MVCKEKLKFPALVGLIACVVIAAPLAQAQIPVPLVLPIVSVTALTVTPASQTISIGGQQQYTAVATYSDATTADVTSDPQTSWSIVVPSVASINSTGFATAVSGGTTNVQAVFYAVTGTASLTVPSTAVTPPPAPTATGGSGSRFWRW